MIIHIEGAQGVGKTTLSKLISEFFKIADIKSEASAPDDPNVHVITVLDPAPEELQRWRDFIAQSPGADASRHDELREEVGRVTAR